MAAMAAVQQKKKQPARATRTYSVSWRGRRTRIQRREMKKKNSKSPRRR
jgi:hypothetical protein